MTQGRMLIGFLKSKPHTYMQMLILGISTCPQKRIVESLRPDERLVKGRDSRNRITWSVRKA